MRVLIAYGSKRGGTEGLAGMLGEALAVRRHTRTLRRQPVWLISSGPLDDSARAGGLAPVRGVAKLAARIGARGEATFGGRLEPDAKGFPASAMAKTHAGDWRDADQIHEFAAGVATDLGVAREASA
ncbi:MAG: hypothetical protein ACHQNA_00395 [Acidimicrobiales bacterium]